MTEKLAKQLFDLIGYHQALRPGLQIQDVYKMLCQSYFGIGHFINDRQSARNYLLDELSQVDAFAIEEELFENISPKQTVYRLNLRVMKKIYLPPEPLIDEMISFSQIEHKDKKEFISVWEIIGELIRGEQLNLSLESYEKFNKTVLEAGYPVVHHSRRYRSLYKPSYRIVRRKFANYFCRGSDFIVE